MFQWDIPALGAKAPSDNRLYLVPVYIGDGRDAILLTVRYWAEFLRGPDGTCAFCHGDPCAEQSGPATLISNFYARNPGIETCPVCNGRPT